MKKISTNPIEELNKVKATLIDPLAIQITESINWIYLKGISCNATDLYPIAIIGEGKPILLLHGFDSCFMEYRRLVPYLAKKFKLIIPDLFGFGFCPRPQNGNYGTNSIVQHLEQVLKTLDLSSGIGLIGASMGGGIAMKLARSQQAEINRLLLLSPAGLTGKSTPIPSPLDALGVCFLKQRFVREDLCKKAFSNPKDAGIAEKQIASIHLNVPGWRPSLAAFARSGGVANCGLPLPAQPISVLWGANDRILNNNLRKSCMDLLSCPSQEIQNCGHLPHIDKPDVVASSWESNSY